MMEMISIGWRDGVVLIAALVAIYLVYTVLRLSRLGKARRDALTAVPPGLTSAPREYAGPMIDLSAELPAELLARTAPTEAPPAAPVITAVPPFSPRPAPKIVSSTPAMSSAPGMPDPAASHEPAPFAQQLARSSLEVELAHLRRESKALAEELAYLREEVAALKAARNVSPLYSEAMSMAQQGAPASGIAGQCGISLAEAELVAALARGLPDEETDEFGEESHDGYPESGTRSGTHG